jgi:hypothetical protein
VVEGNLGGAEVDIVCNVVPDVGIKASAPLCLAANTPLKGWVAGSGSTGEETVLQLGEMGLEKVDLMLKVGSWGIGSGSLDREMVVDMSLVDSSRSLWDQLCTSHVLAIPVGGLVDADLGSLVGGTVGWILITGRKIHV